MKNTDKKPSRRQLRYGKLVRGWDWRTSPELLEKANDFRKINKLAKTELIEQALEKYIEKQ